MKKISVESYLDHQNNYDGICLACGEIKFGDCEPDAENYECDECGKMKVMGIENAMICGHVEVLRFYKFDELTDKLKEKVVGEYWLRNVEKHLTNKVSYQDCFEILSDLNLDYDEEGNLI